MQPSEADRSAVTAQIGRPPRGEWTVKRRCRCGLPQVIETHPVLEDGTPFPTRWWLTCKELCTQIGRLESTGWIRVINEHLKWNTAMRQSLEESTHRYITERDEIHALGETAHPGGGPDRVKCLHAHAAHYLANGDNEIGRAALEEIDWREPLEPCV